MRRVVYQLHLWIGLVLGVYFAFLGLTGSTLVFKTEIERALAPDLYEVAVPASSTRERIDTLLAGFQRAHPGVTSFSARLPQSPDDALIINYIPATPPDWHGPTINPYSPVEPMVSQGRHDRHEVFIDPYTGRTLGDHLVGGTFFYVVHNLHAHLLLEGYGYAFHTYAVLILFVLVVSGLWLWWPSLTHFRKQFKARTRIKFGASFKRIVVDLHNTAGFYAFVVLLAIVTTATLHFWPGPAEAIFLSVSKGLHRPTSDTAELTTPSSARCTRDVEADRYERGVARARSAVPGLSALGIDIDPDTTTVLLGVQADHFVSPRLTSVTLCGLDGRIEQVQSPASTPFDTRIGNWVMFVHFGQWGPGMAFYAIKAIWFLTGLCPAILFASGCTMYVTRQGAKRKKKRSDARVLAGDPAA
ncbi:PepSY-associated TM helix domain-containing protein [Pararobbsia silviterrae]|uniref:PepSY domain-containing protein n=1 Tax=Pararobbsia silviterrae TaxID=1792498 RepID=A0A494XQ07_9BURK|nr:PepSY-associated TM helix domain-containing protein [Pararobbsia silviterrae]RKP51892.1 hypothetical protein D7S86_18265 [Pararobbsia silviterrae]